MIDLEGIIEEKQDQGTPNQQMLYGTLTLTLVQVIID